MVKLTEKDADFIANLLRDAKEGCYDAFKKSEEVRNDAMQLITVTPPDVLEKALKESGVNSLEEFDKEWQEHHSTHKRLLEDFDQALLLLMGGSDER